MMSAQEPFLLQIGTISVSIFIQGLIGPRCSISLAVFLQAHISNMVAMLLRRNRVVAAPPAPNSAANAPPALVVDLPNSATGSAPQKRKKKTSGANIQTRPADLPTKELVRKPARGAWTIQALEQAIDAIDDSVMSIRAASKHFGIPQTTLRNHLGGITLNKAGLVPRALTAAEESDLAAWALQQASHGRAITLEIFRERVAELAIGRPTTFKDGLPGQKWWRGFKKRHPEIRLRSAQPVELLRTRSLTTDNLNNFYLTLQKLYAELQLDPTRIWNSDETGIQAGDRTGIRVLARCTDKYVGGTVPQNREWVTLLCCVNAAGGRIPNMYVFKGKRMRDINVLAGCEAGAVWSYQKKAWITNALFAGWLDHFKNCVPGGVSNDRPHLLILDGHGSHVTVEALTKAREMGLHILLLPPHTSHKLQPLDVACFSPFKKAFRRFRAKLMHSTDYVEPTKPDLAKLIYNAYDAAFSVDNIKSGFAATGICPFSATAVLPDPVADAYAAEHGNGNEVEDGSGDDIDEENAQGETDDNEDPNLAAVVPDSEAPCVGLQTLAAAARLDGDTAARSAAAARLDGDTAARSAAGSKAKRSGGKLPPGLRKKLYVTSDEFVAAKIEYQKQLEEAKELRMKQAEEKAKLREERAKKKEEERVRKEKARLEKEERRKEKESGKKRRARKRPIVEESDTSEEEAEIGNLEVVYRSSKRVRKPSTKALEAAACLDTIQDNEHVGDGNVLAITDVNPPLQVVAHAETVAQGDEVGEDAFEDTHEQLVFEDSQPIEDDSEAVGCSYEGTHECSWDEHCRNKKKAIEESEFPEPWEIWTDPDRYPVASQTQPPKRTRCINELY